MTGTLAFWLTYGVTLATTVIALALDAFGRRREALVALLAGLTTGAVAGAVAGVTHSAGGLVGTIQVGGPASMIYGVVAFVGAAAVFGGLDSLKDHTSGGSIAALIGFSVAAAGVTAGATDLTTLLLALEMMALCGYALVFVARSTRSAEAAMKYFIQGAVATALFLFGMAVFVGVYDAAGKYAALADLMVSPNPVAPALVGAGMILCALVFKMGGVPFHSWAPDAYETASPESAAFLAAGPKIAAIGAASVFIAIVANGALAPRLVVVVAALAVLSILVGSIAALRQADYRRMLAYAGVAQAGYALVAIALFTPPLAVFFGATYAIGATGTFLAAAAFRRARPDWDGTVAGLAGLGRQAPGLSASVAVLLISLAGIPPFLGFWAKFLVFGTGLSFAAQNALTSPVSAWALGIAVTAGIIGSVISLGYYGSVLRALYFDAAPADAPAEPIAPPAAPGSAALAVAGLALTVAVLSLIPLVTGSSALFDFFAAR